MFVLSRKRLIICRITSTKSIRYQRLNLKWLFRIMQLEKNIDDKVYDTFIFKINCGTVLITCNSTLYKFVLRIKNQFKKKNLFFFNLKVTKV